MNNKISYDNIDISYHIENLDSFFSLFFPHLKNYEDHKNYLSKIEDQKVNQKIKENKNKIKENKNKSFFDKLFNFKKTNTNTTVILQEKPKEEEQHSFDKESYFINFPAFYYIDFKLLNKYFENFFSLNKNKQHFAYEEFIQTLEIEIKNIITKNNSYRAVLKNISYFKLPEVMNTFKSDESIIYFFNYVNNKKFNQYDRLGFYENLANYLISDIVFHKNYLFEECFQNFHFEFIKNNDLDCLINYMIKQNTIHLFLKYANLTKDRKIQIEKFIISKEISNF